MMIFRYSYDIFSTPQNVLLSSEEFFRLTRDEPVGGYNEFKLLIPEVVVSDEFVNDGVVVAFAAVKSCDVQYYLVSEKKDDQWIMAEPSRGYYIFENRFENVMRLELRDE